MFSRKRIDSKKPSKLSMNTLLGLRIIVTFWKYYVSKLFTGSISEQLFNREDGKPSGPAAELEESSLMDSTIMDSEKSMSEM